ncbi:MAG: hypothetical protein JJU29_01715 [Verrucomicrobia bacterium]|nr:hypothetical protein [Verrucomicrobiota bacterium]MCH8510950.1 hypothetical protein [Kiritimatiellia bacterium]
MKKSSADRMLNMSRSIIRTALDAARHTDLVSQLEPLLRDKWSKLDGCSFATAFRFSNSPNSLERITPYNPVPNPSEVRCSDHKKYLNLYNAFTSLALPQKEDMPKGAMIPWEIFRSEAEQSAIYRPNIVCLSQVVSDSLPARPPPSSNNNPYNQFIVEDITDTELSHLIEEPKHAINDFFKVSDNDSITDTSLRVFGLCPARIGDKLAVIARGTKERKTSAVIYIMGTRKHFHDKNPSYDYGLMFGINNLIGFDDPNDLQVLVDSVWAAWNIVVVPIYLHDRESRFSSLEAGRDVIHTLKTDIGRNIETQLYTIKNKILENDYENDRSGLDSDFKRVVQDLYVHPFFASFVAREPCRVNSIEELRLECDVEEQPYDPVDFIIAFISDCLRTEESCNTGAFNQVSPDTVEKSYPIHYIRKDFLKLALSEIIVNIHRCGDKNEMVKITFSEDSGGEYFDVIIKNKAILSYIPVRIREQTATIPCKPGHGLSVVRAFCRATGGDMPDLSWNSTDHTISTTLRFGLNTVTRAIEKANESGERK